MLLLRIMPSVFDPSPQYEAAQKKRNLTEALFGGTPAMRAAARKREWMWPGPGEMREVIIQPSTSLLESGTEGSGAGSITKYELRIRESYLENFWLEGVEGAAAMPFKRPWKVEGWGPLMTSWLEDRAGVDQAGRLYRQFLHDAFRMAMGHGGDFILIDMPKKGAPQTLPYWVGIRASELLEPVVEHTSGGPRLEIARIARTVPSVDDSVPWTPQTGEEQIAKIFYAGALDAKAGSDDAKVHCEIYDDEEALRETVTIEPQRESIDFREIPLIPVYGQRSGAYDFEPPYYDQAEQQAAYWRKLSRHDHRAKLIATAILFQSGVDYESDKPKGGMSSDDEGYIWAAEAGADAKMIETTGAALAALSADLDRLKRVIQAGTMQSTLSRPAGDVTAFEIGVTSLRANSRIEAASVFLEGSTQQALEMTALLMGETKFGTVSVPSDLGLPAAGIERLADLYRDGKLTAEGFLPQAKLAGWMSDDFDIQAEVDRLAQRDAEELGLVGIPRPEGGDDG